MLLRIADFGLYMILYIAGVCLLVLCISAHRLFMACAFALGTLPKVLQESMCLVYDNSVLTSTHRRFLTTAENADGALAVHCKGNYIV